MSLWKELSRFFFGSFEKNEYSRDNSAPRDDPFPEEVQITNELDLHGFYPEQLPEVMDEFLSYAVELGIEEVRIAHGKGRSVMKRGVRKILKVDRRVLDFRDAPPGRGGWGATIARLALKEGRKEG